MNFKIKKILPVMFILPAFFPFYFIIADFFSLSDFLTILNQNTLFIIKSTFVQASLSTILCFLFAIGPSLYIKNSKEANLLSKIIRFTFFIPYYYPVVSVVISFSIIFNTILTNYRYTLFTILAAHIFYNTPIMIKYISSAIIKIEKEIIESAVLETSSSIMIHFHIIFRIISKTLLRGAFIVFTFCFMSFGIILALGSVKYSNFEVSIFTALNSRLDFSEAFLYGIVQIILLAILNIFITRTQNNEITNVSYPQKNTASLIETIGALLFTLYELVIIVIPIITFIMFSVKTGKNYFKIIFSHSFNNEFPVIEGIINSFSVSFLTAFLVTTFTYYMLKKGTRILEFIITSIFSISPALLSTTYIYFIIVYEIHPFIMLTTGFFVLTLPFSFSLLMQHVRGFEKSMLEASSLETKNIFKRFLHIEWPILSPVLTLSFLNIFAIVYGEFTFAYVFAGGENFNLISAVNYSIASRRMLGEAYAINTFNTLFILLTFAAILSFSSKLNKKRITA